MKLPDFDVQSLFLDAGWGTVAAASMVCVACAWRRHHGRPPHRRPLALVAALAACCMWLPEPWAPSFWLGMAFQHPSLVLVTLAGMAIVQLLWPQAPSRWRPLLPPIPAATLAILGALLYAGAFAWIPVDLYSVGYDGFAAAAIATLLVVGWTALDRTSGLACVAVALAAFVHAATRLPTGNAWDAILDPMLFAWASSAFAAALWRGWTHRSSLSAGLGSATGNGPR